MSPTGVTYYHLRVKLLESGFDVQRSTLWSVRSSATST